MTDERLARLGQMAALVLEARSARLAQVRAQREALHEKLKALECLPAADQTNDIAAQQSFFRFEKWAAERRAALLLQSARCEAQWLTELEQTRRAFGRAQLLSRLRGR